jgi:hypothetical protein
MIQELNAWQDQLRQELSAYDRSDLVAYRQQQIEHWRRSLQDPLRAKKSAPATFIHRVLIKFINWLHGVEAGLRRLFGRKFKPLYLLPYQPLTDAITEIVKEYIGEIPVSDQDSEADGMGGFTATFVSTYEKRDKLAALLPSGAHLGSPKDLPDPDSHPVLLMFAVHTDARPVWRNFRFNSMRYREIAIGIPHVRLAPEFRVPDREFMFFPRLYLDHFTPTLLGWLFGFAKRLRRIGDTESKFLVSSLSGSEPQVESATDNSIVAAKHAGRAALLHPPSVPEFQRFISWLEQPIVSKAWWGKFRCVYFHVEWSFGLVTPARVDMTVLKDDIPGLSPRKHVSAAASLSGDQRTDGVAYIVTAPWRLLLPFDIKVLRARDAFKFVGPRRRQPPPVSQTATASAP